MFHTETAPMSPLITPSSSRGSGEHSEPKSAQSLPLHDPRGISSWGEDFGSRDAARPPLVLIFEEPHGSSVTSPVTVLQGRLP